MGKLSGYRSRQLLRERSHSLLSQIPSAGSVITAAYPGLQHDILYPPEYRHKHQRAYCEVCSACESENDEVCDLALSSTCDTLGCRGESAKSSRPPDQPAIHFGRIACGNQVIKSGRHRDRLAAEEDVIGFEMESAGVWDCVPTIVVKGVSDYADSHKSKQWQKYAATTAAACTKAILEQWRSADQHPRSKCPSLLMLPNSMFLVVTIVTEQSN